MEHQTGKMYSFLYYYYFSNINFYWFFNVTTTKQLNQDCFLHKKKIKNIKNKLKNFKPGSSRRVS